MTRKRPCHCGKAATGAYTFDQCRRCWLALNDRRYQRLWGLPETAPESRPPDPKPPALGRFSQPAPCVHRGEPTGETRPCPTCTGTVMVPLLACALHGECTTSLLLPGVQCCRICLDRIPA